MTPEIILGAILSLQPTLNEKTARLHAKTIYNTTKDSSDAAALIVTAYRESEFRIGCVIGIGGRGTYGLGVGYSRWACAPLKIQAQMSLQAFYDKGWAYNEKLGFMYYLGARSTRWPEVQTRMRLWTLTKERLECACSI